jgi:hypothetical protein
MIRQADSIPSEEPPQPFNLRFLLRRTSSSHLMTIDGLSFAQALLLNEVFLNALSGPDDHLLAVRNPLHLPLLPS